MLYIKKRFIRFIENELNIYIFFLNKIINVFRDNIYILIIYHCLITCPEASPKVVVKLNGANLYPSAL